MSPRRRQPTLSSQLRGAARAGAGIGERSCVFSRSDNYTFRQPGAKRGDEAPDRVAGRITISCSREVTMVGSHHDRSLAPGVRPSRYCGSESLIEYHGAFEATQR